MEVPSGGSAGSFPKGTRNEARWSEVIAAAGEVFYEKGFVAATLQEVAAKVGLLKGSLYYYIQTKEDLLFAVLERAHAETVAWLLADELRWVGDAPTRMSRFVEQWIEHSERLGAQPHPSEHDLRFLTPEHHRVIIGLRNQQGAVVGDIIELGVQEGSFEPVADVSAAVNTIFQMLINIPRWFRPSGGLSWDELIGWYQVFILRGLGCHSVAGAPAEAFWSRTRQGEQRWPS
jgi:AcrR family transcriptional regulator